MSYIPYTTQAGTLCTPEGSQPSPIIHMIYPSNCTPHQLKLMKDCQECLLYELEISVKDACDINEIPKNAKYFVMPSIKEEFVRQLRTLVSPIKPCIYTPRLIIEARVHRKLKLPARTIAISLTMYDCHVFLTKTCNMPDLRQKINEMCGTVVPSFKNQCLNILVTDRADDKYCIRARQKGLTCVTRSWILENHRNSLRDDENMFGNNALATRGKHEVKPFHGLHFKINVRHSESYIKSLIAENQGKVVYGDASCVTHEVIEDYVPSHYDDPEKNISTYSLQAGPKKVDVRFIEKAAKLGYYLTHEEYKQCRESEEDKKTNIKREPITQRQSIRPIDTQSDTMRHPSSLDSDVGFSPPAPPADLRSNSNFAAPQAVNGYISISRTSQRSQTNENQSMLPPPQAPRQTRMQQQPIHQQQHDHSNSIMKDVILKALHGCDNGSAQTQLASTQMRGLPERAIQIEQTMEPSQQLYWSDNVPRRN